MFDTLDFEVFSNQKWDQLDESYAQEIIVTWPDGHDTKEIEQQIKDLTAMFVCAQRWITNGSNWDNQDFMKQIGLAK